ncbi:hypothetical protein BDW59DRAFT_166118 [Aspergillus cavernicola]|uniref:PRISE-like Rossmann-fold domain-containing protein n=1 Tax=Aspergillus cavernicola TaxID=176166 RepID=A0ABR4HNM3_9EURO
MTTTQCRAREPRIPSPYGDEILYYNQVDVIKTGIAGATMAVISLYDMEIALTLFKGYVSAVTSMTYVQPIALYLALYRYANGQGTPVAFPGTKKIFVYTYTDSSQDIVTRAEIYLSVSKPEEANGEAFNIAIPQTRGLGPSNGQSWLSTLG